MKIQHTITFFLLVAASLTSCEMKDEIFDKNPLFSFKKCCAIIHRYQVRGKISFFTLTSYYYDIRVKRSKSRSCLHDKTFELGTRQT